MSDDLVKRLRELRSNQYADPNTAPDFVFLDPDLPPSEWEKQYGMDVVYVRADRIEELEADLRKMALDYLAAEGQAAEAYQAQLEAEAKLARAVDGLREIYGNGNAAGRNPQLMANTARSTLAEIEGEPCPSCREPLALPSGDGCAAMTKHTTLAELKGENRG